MHLLHSEKKHSDSGVTVLLDDVVFGPYVTSIEAIPNFFK